MTTKRKPDYFAYTVTGEGDKAFWTPIGSVWAHNSGEGLSVDLAALPVNGRIVLMPPKAETEDTSCMIYGIFVQRLLDDIAARMRTEMNGASAVRSRQERAFNGSTLTGRFQSEAGTRLRPAKVG